VAKLLKVNELFEEGEWATTCDFLEDSTSALLAEYSAANHNVTWTSEVLATYTSNSDTTSGTDYSDGTHASGGAKLEIGPGVYGFTGYNIPSYSVVLRITKRVYILFNVVAVNAPNDIYGNSFRFEDQSGTLIEGEDCRRLLSQFIGVTTVIQLLKLKKI
jgi:hypothetical protein